MKSFTRKTHEFKAHKDGMIFYSKRMGERRTKNYGEFSKVVLIMFKQGELK